MKNCNQKDIANQKEKILALMEKDKDKMIKKRLWFSYFLTPKESQIFRGIESIVIIIISPAKIIEYSCLIIEIVPKYKLITIFGKWISVSSTEIED